jgi:hypothetical protein
LDLHQLVHRCLPNITSHFSEILER